MDLSGAERIVIIGGGQAGAQAAFSLRQWGYAHELTLVAEEPSPPYQRPPLSKAYFKGEMAEARLYLKPDEWYTANNVSLLTGRTAARIDRPARSVTLDDGQSLAYDALILATGSRPRALPVRGTDLGNVFELRSLADVSQLRSAATPGKHLIIIGAGYIGLEAAAVARQIGLEVTVLEMAPRVLERVTSPVISQFYEREHRAQGVRIRCGVHVEALTGATNVTEVSLAGGEVLPADLVLVGIGIVPGQELALESGIACSNGINTDRDTRTSDPYVLAAGDCTSRPLVHYGRRGRLESVHNAIEQGKLAAAAILGRKRLTEDVPWFWSDQYDIKLQIAGLSAGHDQTVVRGDPATRKFAVFYLRAGKLIAVDAINSPPEFMASKKLIMSGAYLAPDVLQDTSIPMKEIAAMVAA